MGLSWWECRALEKLDPHSSPAPAKFTSTWEYWWCFLLFFPWTSPWNKAMIKNRYPTLFSLAWLLLVTVVGQGSSQDQLDSVKSLMPQLLLGPFLQLRLLFQCPAEEHGYFYISLVFARTTNALNEQHTQNAHLKIMFSPVHGKEVNKRKAVQCHWEYYPPQNIRWKQMGHKNEGKQVQTSNTGEKKELCHPDRPESQQILFHGGDCLEQ